MDNQLDIDFVRSRILICRNFLIERFAVCGLYQKTNWTLGISCSTVLLRDGIKEEIMDPYVSAHLLYDGDRVS